MKNNKELIKEFDNLSSLESEDIESHSDSDSITLDSSSPKSINLYEHYYDEEIYVNGNGEGEEEYYQEEPEEDEYSEEEEDYSQNTSNPPNVTSILNKIIEKLTELTQLTTNFNQFKKEINFKLEGKHTEYEILIEDLMNNVRREGNKQSLLVKSLRDELIGSKLKGSEELVELNDAEIGGVIKTVESVNNTQFESNLELLDQVQDNPETSELATKSKYFPAKPKITTACFILSIL